MAYNSPFRPHGKTVSLQTSATPGTSQNYQILASDFGLTSGQIWPAHFRIINNGTADIWFAARPTAGLVAAFPTIVAGTAGTSQVGFRLKPGVVEVFTLQDGPAFWVSDVSGTASQPYDLSPGEGQ